MTDDNASPDPENLTPQAESRSRSDTSWGSRWDSIAQERFDRHDWIELAATILLSLATIVAAWSAYQSTRWGGVQTSSYSASAAKRTLATQYNGQYAAQLQIDVITWLSYLEHRQDGDEIGASFLRERLRAEFAPAFDAWEALVPEGEVPPDTPFSLPEYQPAARRQAEKLNAEAEELAATARDANQVSDNFVLVAVIMASVLFFAGVGNKLNGEKLRLFMLAMGIVLFGAGTLFMLSLPQDFGI